MAAQPNSLTSDAAADNPAGAAPRQLKAGIVGRPIAALDTPAVLVHLDALGRNIARMARTIISEAGVGWRPHTKAMKTPEIARMCIAAGAHGVTCAKLGEAEAMAQAGIDDILVANQIVGPAKIERLVRLCKVADVMVCVDDPGNAEEISAAAGRVGVRPRVLIEIDVGLNRAGVPPGDGALALARRIAELKNIRFCGLQTWESHALRAGDADEKRRLIVEALSAVRATAEQMRASGLPVDIVSCGGTGTYWISAFQPGVTEIEAGGGVFGDSRYRHMYGVDHEYAMTILSLVTSRPTPRRIVCDAGFKTSAVGYGEPELIGLGEVEGLRFSAEHGIVNLVEPSTSPRSGDRIEFVPGYSDATVFLHDNLYGIRDGRVETVWPVLGRDTHR